MNAYVEQAVNSLMASMPTPVHLRTIQALLRFSANFLPPMACNRTLSSHPAVMIA